MKKIITISLILTSFNSFALSCNGFDYKEVIKESDFIYKATLKQKTNFITPKGYKELKNEMNLIETLKGNPESFIVYTHKPFNENKKEEMDYDINKSYGFNYDYAASKQIKEGTEYYITGKYGERVFFGVCGGQVFKVDGVFGSYLQKK